LKFLRIVTCISEAPEAVENRDIASKKRLPFLIELLLVLAYWTGLAHELLNGKIPSYLDL